ncbi:hypothetical protein AGDE_04396 [Angomonas deanei]|uniref:Cofilin/tropomyosin-type actin-binding protein, putative n=1 Tax=Angomonas deanei TaxID=59799 RepID=S9V931_9TRYP|nr:hypothetical protein AGDE_11042 [Angomonas deanei]EPY31522.1 hypothetical protein AGDE_09010 [Angomonas deanei]EPY39532.1 hypothetical protein AGDE_04396 [Angomonas deanei]CAD2218013.1 Cofilin/tropomyosin-type actin-binding protein, putative [Angomonas deanei]|eukprot:EPY26887.1 hypothetical protein AGDE_11042 [Angomonas deanei]
MSKVICRARGSDEITSAVNNLDDTKVQILFSKFPVGTGTFKRNKFIFVQYIGPQCGVVKRGRAITELNAFTNSHLHGVAGFSTTDKASLTFEDLVQHMRSVFVTDDGSFSMDQIKEEYRTRLREERKMMHREGQAAAAQEAAKKKREAAAAKPQVKVAKPKPAAPAEPVMDSKALTQLTERVLASLREPEGPINWAVLEADPKNLAVKSYGRNGIFELVKNLPDDAWLFGLFRISFNINNNRERRIIFFQWIGSKLKAVKTAGRAGIYPGMTKALAPYAYEIYLVGQGDLNAQAIINKSKSAFADVKAPALSSGGGAPSTINFTEEGYKESLKAEMDATKDVPFEAFVPTVAARERAASVTTADEDELMSATLLSSTIDGPQQAQGVFDVDETVKLIQAREGGLVWGVFDVV